MSDPYTNHLIKLIIAKCAQQHGFSYISETSLAILIESVVDFVYKTAKLASEATSMGGRIDTNIYDLLFSLNHLWQETIFSLHSFHNNGKHKIPSIEYKVPPYPKPMKSSFYLDQEQKQMTTIPHPFRLFTNFKPSKFSTEVPEFYPDYPPEYTYKTARMAFKNQISQIDLDKQRSKEQKVLQEQIENIRKDTALIKKNVIRMPSQLTDNLTTAISREPPPETLENHLVFYGYVPSLNPEDEP